MDELILLNTTANNTGFEANGDDDTIPISTIAIIVSVAAFLMFCCLFTLCFSGAIDNFINGHLSGSDVEYADRALRRQQEEEEKKKEDPEVRRQKLLLSFDRNKVTTVVSEQSFAPTRFTIPGKYLSSGDDDESNSTGNETFGHSDSEGGSDKGETETSDLSDIEEDSGENVPSVGNDVEEGQDHLYIPRLASKNKEVTHTKIPNCCAICLCPYDVGDTIVWSCNKTCNHAFHDECIVPWLVKQQNGECPCCRSQFTDLPPPSKTRGKRSLRAWFSSYSFLSQRE
mmetsp:Transcript_18549/g.21127  ORF Transcript_18549/g.21127 Transcript_18549/m.21127 type:complete len:285 (-) Transcript_18549:88-942(-)